MNASAPTAPVSALILAGGSGVRMRSVRPKPLHVLCGRPLVGHAIDALALVSIRRTVMVVGAGGELVAKKVAETMPEAGVEFIEQRTPRGTGDAVAVALTAFSDDDYDLIEDFDDDVLVLPGDLALLRPETIAALVEDHQRESRAATLLTAPAGYGRGRGVIRGRDGRIVALTHDTAGETIEETATGVGIYRRSLLAPAIRRSKPLSPLSEYDVDAVVSVLAETGHFVDSVTAADPLELTGVNDRTQLALAEAEIRKRTNARWLDHGVTMLDPARTYIDTTVELAADVTLFPGTMLQGKTVVGPGAQIGPDTRLVDCAIGARAVVEVTQGRDAEVGPDAHVGPFASLPPGAQIAAEFRTGAFFRADSTDPADQ